MVDLDLQETNKDEVIIEATCEKCGCPYQEYFDVYHQTYCHCCGATGWWLESSEPKRITQSISIETLMPIFVASALLEGQQYARNI